MKTGTMVDYAVNRTKDHINNFTSLYQGIKNKQLDQDWLGKLETKNSIFPEVDYRIYSSN
jgi:1,4-alpha-glucan branching enzyme